MAPAVELASRGFPVSYALAESLKGSKSLAASPESKRIFQKNGAVLRRRRNAGAAGTGANALADLEERPERILRGRDREAVRRRDGEARRHHHARRSEGLQGDRAHAAVGQLSRLHDHYRAAVQLGRHRLARDAGHPRRHRLREGRRRLGVVDPLSGRSRCAAPTPTATNTSAIRTS